MKISMKEVRALPSIEKVIIHSLDLSLYQASIMIDDQERIVCDSKGKLLKSTNKLEMQALFTSLPVKKMVLRHQSAYDEMVNQPTRQGSNLMEVPIGGSDLARTPPTIQ
ncbi:MAG: DUF6482 family protein [Oleibacter sp.]|nr:DUF6482 family protein [Thalassolituus sp.]